MTTSQNRQPKGTTSGGQFAPDSHAEATLLLDPARRPVNPAPGESDTFTELADGDVIETLNVSRSDDGSGYWVSPAKTVNIKDLITDTDPRLHGEALDAWLEKNGPVLEDFLAERYEADITTDEGWDEVGIECAAQLPDGPLTEIEAPNADSKASMHEAVGRLRPFRTTSQVREITNVPPETRGSTSPDLSVRLVTRYLPSREKTAKNSTRGTRSPTATKTTLAGKDC